MAFFFRGSAYDEHVQSRHYLIGADAPPRLVLEADGYFCSHVQGCPTDPNLYAYDRWPSPERYIEQALHLHTLDGKHVKPAARGGIGIDLYITEHIVINAQASALLTTFESPDIGDVDDLNYMSVAAGLQYRF